MQTFIYLVLLYLLAELTASILAHVVVWYEHANAAARQLPDDDPGNTVSPGPILYPILMGIVVTLYGQLLIRIFYHTAWIPRLWPALPAPVSPNPGTRHPSPPVLLVHGLYHNASAWPFYRFWLRKAGFKNLYFSNYASFRGNFPVLAQELGATIRTISREHNGQKVLLVGHSMGGLLIRTCLCDSDTRDCVRAVATLCTPHQGTTLAPLGFGSLARSLAFHGPLIRHLERTEQATSDTVPYPPARSLYARLDCLVQPDQASRLTPHLIQHGWTEQQTTSWGHIPILFHKPTFDRILAFWKETGVTTAETTQPEDCVSQHISANAEPTPPTNQ